MFNWIKNKFTRKQKEPNKYIHTNEPSLVHNDDEAGTIMTAIMINNMINDNEQKVQSEEHHVQAEESTYRHESDSYHSHDHSSNDYSSDSSSSDNSSSDSGSSSSD